MPDRQLGERREGLCRTLFASGGNLSERHAHIIRLSGKVREDNAVRRRQLRHDKVYSRQIRRVALWQQHHHMGLPVGIRIDIGGEVDPLFSRRIEPLNNPRSATPLRGHCQFEM